MGASAAPIVVLRADAAPLAVEIILPALTAELAWHLLLEEGGERTGRADFKQLPLVAERGLDGQALQRRRLALGSDIPWGYHRLSIRPGGAATTLVVSPGWCWLPPVLATGRRLWGIAAQLYLLRSATDWGIGDFGDLRSLVELAAAHGADVIGLDRLHAMFTDNPEHAGPYSPASRLLLNVLNIVLPTPAGCLAGRADWHRHSRCCGTARLRRTHGRRYGKVNARGQVAYHLGIAKQCLRRGDGWFLREALDPSRSAPFFTAFLPFQERIARLGFRNTLVQTALKLTLPGMPDIYQGTELWDLSLVDPDNRRSVDYGLRTEVLEELSAPLAPDRVGMVAELFDKWHDGRLKLALTAALLAHRRARPALYGEGAYEPLAASGPRADHLCAFARSHGEDMLLVVAARFPARLEAESEWGETILTWPPTSSHIRRWHCLLTGRTVERTGETVAAAALLGEQAVAVFAALGEGRP
jgi:hypothetical protein